jgi:hypothetical protein
MFSNPRYAVFARIRVQGLAREILLFAISRLMFPTYGRKYVALLLHFIIEHRRAVRVESVGAQVPV